MKLCSDELWESLVRADDSATFFQTPAWFQIAAAHYHAECAPLVFTFSDVPSSGVEPVATESTACLPLLRDRRWGRTRYFSPFGTYTALVCPRALTPDEIAQVETQLAKLNIHLTSSPFTHTTLRAGTPIPTLTQVIDLAHVDPANSAAAWAPDPRRKLRMAREAGVTVRTAVSPADWDAYYGVYEKSLERWGERATSRYPRGLFEEIAKLPPESMRLWIAESGDEGGRSVAAGYIAFYHNRHACIWHGASDPELFKVGAVQQLYHDMIADAVRRGYAVFDLLGSGGTASLEAFKASFGAEKRIYDSFLNRTGLVGRLAPWKDAWRAAWTSSRETTKSQKDGTIDPANGPAR